MFAFVFV